MTTGVVYEYSLVVVVKCSKVNKIMNEETIFKNVL